MRLTLLIDQSNASATCWHVKPFATRNALSSADTRR
jgi:hypothetical protein